METRKNLCAMLPVALHARVRQEQEKAGMTLGEYVEAMITEYYDWKDGKIMTGEMRTLAAQIPAELFDRLDCYLKERGIKKKDFLWRGNCAIQKTSQLRRGGSVFCAKYPRCYFTTGNVSGCTNAASEQGQEVREKNDSSRISTYKPHSVFRVRRFLSSEGAERNGQMGLLQTRSRHNRLQFRLLQ